MLPDGVSRNRIIIVVVAAFLLVQIAVPVVSLFGPRPARFAWQMYSGSRAMATLSVVYDDGRVEPVSWDDYLIHPRLDMDLLTLLPPRICSLVEGATAVRIDPVQGHPEDVPCADV